MGQIKGHIVRRITASKVEQQKLIIRIVNYMKALKLKVRSSFLFAHILGENQQETWEKFLKIVREENHFNDENKIRAIFVRKYQKDGEKILSGRNFGQETISSQLSAINTPNPIPMHSPNIGYPNNLMLLSQGAINYTPSVPDILPNFLHTQPNGVPMHMSSQSMFGLKNNEEVQKNFISTITEEVKTEMNKKILNIEQNQAQTANVLTQLLTMIQNLNQPKKNQRNPEDNQRRGGRGGTRSRGQRRGLK